MAQLIINGNEVSTSSNKASNIKYKEETVESALNNVNENLTIEEGYVFKVGKDGDGNVCYYGADGSLIPFKSGDIYPKIVKSKSQYMKNNSLAYEMSNISNILYIGWNKSYIEKLNITNGTIISLGDKNGAIILPNESTVTFSTSVEIRTLTIWEIEGIGNKLNILSNGGSYGGTITINDIKKGDLFFVGGNPAYITGMDSMQNLIITSIDFTNESKCVIYLATDDIARIVHTYSRDSSNIVQIRKEAIK